MKTIPPRNAYLSAADVARHLCMSQSAIRGAIAKGLIKAIRIGRTIRVPRAELERLESPVK